MSGMKKEESICPCHKPDAPVSCFDSRYVGIDDMAGRFGTVDILTCRQCGSRWIRYSMEVEGITSSGRWFRGLADGGDENAVTPERALDLLRGLDWYFYGGSYFRSTGGLGRGRIPLD